MRNRDIPTNRDDVIDSRDVIARLDELESERDALLDAVSESETDEDADANKESLADWDSANGEEYDDLKALIAEGEDASGDWSYGETLIRESYFTDYARELVADISDLPRDLPSYIVIDWEATANNIKADYSTVDFDGVDYLIRSR